MDIRDLGGDLMMNDKIREYGQKCYQAGRLEVVEAIEEQGVMYKGNPWWDAHRRVEMKILIEICLAFLSLFAWGGLERWYNNMVAGWYCGKYGHRWVKGYWWYPWGVASWWELDDSYCSACCHHQSES